MEKTPQQLRQEIVDRLEKAKKIVDGLENNESFKLYVQDFKNWGANLDKAWAYISDEKKLKEAQITKMATDTIVNSLNNYKHDLEKATEQLAKMDNPDLAIEADFDNE